MRDTIKAKIGYSLWTARDPETNEKVDGYRILCDGDEAVMLAKLAKWDEYLYNKDENECFNLCEVFTTQKGNQFIYWRDEEIDQDYLTKVHE